MSRLVLIAAGLAGALLILLVAWGSGTQAQATTKQRGVSYPSFFSGQYSQPGADLAVSELAATGANWMSLIVTGYQETITSTTIMTTTATPTDADLINAIATAHARGLRVMLKPHVDLSNDPTHWRGQISFTTEADWNAWFSSYTAFMAHYADLAKANQVEQFSAGTELIGTSSREPQWRSVIAAMRAKYGGPVIYASDWATETTSINWWDAVDLIGVDAYYPLTSKDDPTVAELKAGWAPHVADLASLSSKWGKTIIFPEIGYQSRVGANRNPAGGPGSLDLQEQSNAYEAAFESVYDQPWFGGMYWWFWETDPFQGGSCDTNFTPHDKPAEDVLRSWYGAPPRPAPGTPPPPDYSRVLNVYGDSLSPDWQDWSFNATRSFTATDQVYSGTNAISVTLGAYGGLALRHEPFDSNYYWLEFYIRGAPPGNQQLWVYFKDADGVELNKRPVNDCRYISGGTINAGSWKRVLVPLSDLNLTGRRLSVLTFQESAGQAGTSFWIDEIRLVGTAHRTYLPYMPR